MTTLRLLVWLFARLESRFTRWICTHALNYKKAYEVAEWREDNPIMHTVAPLSKLDVELIATWYSVEQPLASALREWISSRRRALSRHASRLGYVQSVRWP